MSKLKILLYICAAALITITYQNCSGIAASPMAVSATAMNTNGNPNLEDIVSNCQNSALFTKQQTVNFADSRVETGRTQVCEFAATATQETANGNLSKLNEYLRSRHEQKRTLSGIPSNAVICSFEINATNLNYVYDDIFYLTYNGYIVASNFKDSILARTQPEIVNVNGQAISLFPYDWTKVRNELFGLDANGNGPNINSNPNDYCLGQSAGTTCQWPLSQQTGNLQMKNFPLPLMITLADKKPLNDQTFGLIITGDDNPNDDCYHSDLNLDVTVKYYLK
ncbi:MAG: hypothetical protein V4736_02945 [Bdellovibrionota bacterium]